MSRLEKRVYEDLKMIFGDRVECQPEIDDCVFEEGGKYTADFYLRDIDLFIEVKGYMTVFEANKYQYVFALDNKNYYLFHAYNEDWFGESVDINKSVRDIHEELYQTQLEELRALLTCNGNGPKKAVAELSDKCRARLAAYIKLRSHDLEKWSAEYTRKTGKKLNF